MVRGGAPRSARLVTVQYKAELVAFDTDAAGLPVKAPIVRPMNAGELEEHRARRPPKPDVAAENATDGAAIAKLERDAPDVLKTLQKITKPTLLREIAPMLDATNDGADEKDVEKGTPFNSRIRRLQRLIGTATSPRHPCPVHRAQGEREDLPPSVDADWERRRGSSASR